MGSDPFGYTTRMGLPAIKHEMLSYMENDFCHEFFRAYVMSKKARSGTFTYRGEPFCWGHYYEYGPPPEGALAIEIVQEGFALEEFRVWFGVPEGNRIRRARHVQFNELESIKAELLH